MSHPAAQSVLAVLAIVTVAVVGYAAVTHEFSVVTTEEWRRVSIKAFPRSIPSTWGIDQDGRGLPIFKDVDRPGQSSRVTIVDFIYTRCVSICRALGTAGEQLQAEIRSRHVEDRVRLVSISFDPIHDSPEALRQYALRLHADPKIWTFLRPDDPERLPDLLAAFGVVVVDAPLEQFQHNAAFHVLDGRGRLTRVVEPDDAIGALDAALMVASAGTSSQ